MSNAWHRKKNYKKSMPYWKTRQTMMWKIGLLRRLHQANSHAMQLKMKFVVCTSVSISRLSELFFILHAYSSANALLHTAASSSWFVSLVFFCNSSFDVDTVYMCAYATTSSSSSDFLFQCTIYSALGIHATVHLRAIFAHIQLKRLMSSSSSRFFVLVHSCCLFISFLFYIANANCAVFCSVVVAF